jgi:hypothetical protein
VVLDQDVGGLQVAVLDRVGVQVEAARCDLLVEQQDLGQRGGGLEEVLGEVALAELHYDVDVVLGLAEVDHLYEVGVGHVLEDFDLAVDSLDQVLHFAALVGLDQDALVYYFAGELFVL